MSTNIWKAGEKYRREQGHYPVIFLTFKDVKYNTWEEAKINLYSVIQAEYRRHIYLFSSGRITDVDKQYVEKTLQGTLDVALWAGTLANLALLLDLHYGLATIILIDEYDTPIQQGYMKGFHEFRHFAHLNILLVQLPMYGNYLAFYKRIHYNYKNDKYSFKF